MSGSVWFDEVDAGFILFIQSIVKVLNSEGELQSVPVDIRKPDEDFLEESYPRVTLHNLYDTFSKVRYDRTPVITSRDEVSKTVSVEQSALPYDLFYQLDFWSTLQSEFSFMTKKWLSKVGRDFNLPVVDDSTVSRSCYVLQIGSMRKEDFLANGERVFHAYLTYRVWVELDESVAEVTPMVAEPVTVIKNEQY
jgi:hypothetical protein